MRKAWDQKEISTPMYKCPLWSLIKFFFFFFSSCVQAPAASGNASGSSSSLPQGLTGWAAFTKTSNVGPSSTKLSTSQPGSSKSTPPPSGSKPVGLSALANAKPGLANKPSGGSGGGSGNGNNGSSTVPMKPPPPLTLGKQVLSRSASGDSLGKMTVTGSLSPGAAPSSSLGGNGGSGGNGGGNSGGSSGNNNNNGNGAKASADGKTPTSQESQLNAMKRLQMVKKKAAQKKLKKWVGRSQTIMLNSKSNPVFQIIYFNVTGLSEADWFEDVPHSF